MELNNTPVRTSKNFNINNIKIDVKIPEDIKEFTIKELRSANNEKINQILNEIEGL